MQLPELAHKLTARTETRTVLWRAQTNSKIIGLELHDTLQQAEPLPLCPAQCNVATTNCIRDDCEEQAGSKKTNTSFYVIMNIPRCSKAGQLF